MILAQVVPGTTHNKYHFLHGTLETGHGTWDMGHMVFRFNTTGLLVTGTVLILKCSYIALLLGTAVLYDIEGENSEKPRGDFGWQESTAPVKLSPHCATKHLVRL
jgi:hypothetical protein